MRGLYLYREVFEYGVVQVPSNYAVASRLWV